MLASSPFIRNASAQAPALRQFDYRKHDVNEVGLVLYNGGRIDYLEFPRGSELEHGFIEIAVGCARALDTLVSSGGEWSAFQPIFEQTRSPRSPIYSDYAKADQEFVATWFDTLLWGGAVDEIELRPHKPIGLSMQLVSRAWSGGFMKRFVLLELVIKNISDRPLDGGYIGFEVKPSTRYYPGWPIWSEGSGSVEDEICGFLPTVPSIAEGKTDTVDLAWWADNDGEPEAGVYVSTSQTSIAGIRLLERPEPDINYNWYALKRSPDDWDKILYAWAPGKRGDRSSYGGWIGLPGGDRATYHVMRNGEVDYDQVYSAIDQSDGGWREPAQPPWAASIAGGFAIGSLISSRLPQLMPGNSTRVTLAIVFGVGFHFNPMNYDFNFHASNPRQYVDNLDFTDLIKNARWAGWVFDNPGVDTDGDGYRGKAHLVNCVDGRCDSVFYEGDGVPDWRGPGPPYPPVFDLTSQPAAITLRWSGEFSELQRDPLSGRRDFEGYRVYTGRFDRDDQYSLVASWDIDDYKRFAYDPDEKTWVQASHPSTVGEWQRIIGDAQFDPCGYPVPAFERAYRDTVTDTVRNVSGEIIRVVTRERYSYWQREDYNRGNEYNDNGQWVQNAIQRVGVRDTIVGEDTLSYGVYEVTIDHLNPAVPLYFAVTAFDFGNHEVDLEPLESSPSNNSQYAHPIYSTDVVIDSGLRVSVYPNPYKVIYDGASGEPTTYYQEGYEGRGIYKFEEQDRRIWFVNLPEKATIRIFSLDGDLIRTINHPDPFLTKYPSAVGWDLVSRNIQAVTSGIYIWRVDSELGTQTGKLVIIK